MDMCLSKFDIYQGTVALTCFKSQHTLDVLIFFKKRSFVYVRLKFTLSYVTSFLTNNLSGLKKIIFRPDNKPKKVVGKTFRFFFTYTVFFT